MPTSSLAPKFLRGTANHHPLTLPIGRLYFGALEGGLARMSEGPLSWRQRDDVRAFAQTLAEYGGGLLRFDGIGPSAVRGLLADAPEGIACQAPDEGPSIEELVELAERHGALLGGFLSLEALQEVTFFSDTMVLPPGADLGIAEELDAEEVNELEDGSTRLWWD